jgi:hypothetical protein
MRFKLGEPHLADGERAAASSQLERVIAEAPMKEASLIARWARELSTTAGLTEDVAGWLTFFGDLVARGLTGVTLVTSDAHAGLVAAAGATLPGAGWQRCRTHSSRT